MSEEPIRRDEASVKAYLNAFTPNSSVRPSEAATLKVQIQKGEMLNERSKVAFTILIRDMTPPFFSIKERRIEIPHYDTFNQDAFGQEAKELNPEAVPFFLGVRSIQVKNKPRIITMDMKNLTEESIRRAEKRS